MGFAPADVYAMTLDEFEACVAGWNRAQGNAPAPELNDQDYDVLCGLQQKWNGVER